MLAVWRRHLALHAQSRTQLVVGVTDNVNSYNPIADSAAFMASVWCQVYGCLVTYDYQAAAYKGMLVERWEVLDPTTWVFHLRRDAEESRWPTADRRRRGVFD